MAGRRVEVEVVLLCCFQSWMSIQIKPKARSTSRRIPTLEAIGHLILFFVCLEDVLHFVMKSI